MKLFEQITDPHLMVRRITINANRIITDPGFYQLTLFSDTKQQEKEKKLQETMLSIKKKYGKNAILKGTNFKKGATMIERNEQIGGHKS